MIQAYAQLREALQLGTEDMRAFEDRCLAVVRLRRPWHRPTYIVQRIRIGLHRTSRKGSRVSQIKKKYR